VADASDEISHGVGGHGSWAVSVQFCTGVCDWGLYQARDDFFLVEFSLE